MSEEAIPTLEFLVEEAIDEFLKHVSAQRWDRLKDGIHWSENLEEKSIQLEAIILEKTPHEITVGVSASYQHTIETGIDTRIGPEINTGTHFVVQRPNQ